MIEVFRPGTSHIVNGITCERDTVNEFGFEPLLENGWFLTPEECYPKVVEKIIDKAVGDAVNSAKEAFKALEKKTPETADSKVTAREKSASSGNLKAKTPSKTTTKMAVKK